MKYFIKIASTLFCLGLLCVGFAQEMEFTTVETEEGDSLFTMPETSNAIEGVYRIDGAELVIERHIDMWKYEAKMDGEDMDSIVQWISDTDLDARFVFNIKQKKFERLTNSVRVVLEDYDQLEEFIEETEATKGKAYPSLGYAIIQLPEDKHPVEYVKEIEERADTTAATVMVEQPRNKPL